MDSVITCEEDDIGVCIDGNLQDIRAVQLRQRHYNPDTTASETSNDDEINAATGDSFDDYEYNNGTSG